MESDSLGFVSGLFEVVDEVFGHGVDDFLSQGLRILLLALAWTFDEAGPDLPSDALIYLHILGVKFEIPDVDGHIFAEEMLLLLRITCGRRGLGGSAGSKTDGSEQYESQDEFHGAIRAAVKSRCNAAHRRSRSRRRGAFEWRH